MIGLAAPLLASLTVLFVGDSISDGVGAAEGEGFVARIADARPGWTVVEAGCPGASTRDWVRPKTPDAPAYCSFGGAFALLAAEHADAELVHVLLGTNDAIGAYEDAALTPEDFARNLVRLAQRFEGEVIVSLPPPVPDPEDRVQRLLDQYAGAVRWLAGQPDPAFRLGADLTGLDRALLDGVHPRSEGHDWIAERVLRVLDAAIAQLDRRDDDR